MTSSAGQVSSSGQASFAAAPVSPTGRGSFSENKMVQAVAAMAVVGLGTVSFQEVRPYLDRYTAMQKTIAAGDM